MDEAYSSAHKDEHVIRIETTLTLGNEKAAVVDLEKRRSAIKAALEAATAGLVATTAGLAGHTGDVGTPPWDEVIHEPVWPERHPEFGQRLTHAAQIRFWR